MSYWVNWHFVNISSSDSQLQPTNFENASSSIVVAHFGKRILEAREKIDLSCWNGENQIADRFNWINIASFLISYVSLLRCLELQIIIYFTTYIRIESVSIYR